MLLGAVALACWTVAGPIAEIRRVVELCATGTAAADAAPSADEGIERLGGPQYAARRLGFELRTGNSEGGEN